MVTRTSYMPVRFNRPFMLRGIDRVQPPGTYTVETNEELFEGLAISAYRRVSTLIFLPARQGGAATGEVASIDPWELEAAQKEDVLAGRNAA